MTIGNRYNFWIKTAIGSEAAIRLYPDWGYTEMSNVDKSTIRTQGGQLNVYTVVSSWEEFILPVQVSSESANLIKTWWKTGILVHFTRNNSLGGVAGFDLIENVRCRIANKTEPFPNNMDAQFDMFNGTIDLVTV